MQLPFKTKPKNIETVTVGDENTGTLEIKKLYGLTPNELIFIKEFGKGFQDIRTYAILLSKKIAKTKNIKVSEAYKLFSAIGGENSDILDDYMEEINEFQEKMEESSLHKKLAYAASILRFRLNVDCTINDLGNVEFIHPKLVDAIADFAFNEENGWKETIEELKDEDLGK